MAEMAPEKQGTVPIDLGRRVLARAIDQAGSIADVARALDMHPILLNAYVEGKRPIPEALFVHIVDLAMKGEGQKTTPQS